MLSHILKDKADEILDNLEYALDAGLAVLNKDLNIIWANKTLTQILNLKYNPIGKSCHEVYMCECRDAKHCSVLQALSSGKKQYSEIQLVTEKGERKYIRNITTPIRDGSDGFTHLLKLSLDITEQEEKI